jgi:hypothetical protein
MEMECIGMIIKILKYLLGLFDTTPPVQEPAPPAQELPRPTEAASEPVQTSAPDHSANTGQLNVPGNEVMLGGRLYVIAPLNAAAVRQYRQEINSVFVGGLPDIELVSKLALASLRRNYPQMTMAVVEEFIDYENYFVVWEALMNLSGLVAQAKEMMRRVQDQMEAAGLKP